MDSARLERNDLDFQIWAALGMLSNCFVVSMIGWMFFENKYTWVSLGIVAGVVSALFVPREDFFGSFAGLALSIISAYFVFNSMVGGFVVTVFMAQSVTCVLFARMWLRK